MKKTMLKIIGCLMLATSLNAQAGLSLDALSNECFDRLTTFVAGIIMMETM